MYFSYLKVTFLDDDGFSRLTSTSLSCPRLINWHVFCFSFVKMHPIYIFNYIFSKLKNNLNFDNTLLSLIVSRDNLLGSELVSTCLNFVFDFTCIL